MKPPIRILEFQRSLTLGWKYFFKGLGPPSVLFSWKLIILIWCMPAQSKQFNVNHSEFFSISPSDHLTPIGSKYSEGLTREKLTFVTLPRACTFNWVGEQLLQLQSRAARTTNRLDFLAMPGPSTALNKNRAGQFFCDWRLGRKWFKSLKNVTTKESKIS